MSTTVPTWTNNAAELIAPLVLPTGGFGGATAQSIYRFEWDLTTKAGGMLVACLGHLTTTGITGNVFFRLRRKLLSSTWVIPADYVSYQGFITTAPTVAYLSTTQASQSTGGAILNAATSTITNIGAGPALFLGVTTAWATGATVTVAMNTSYAEFVRVATGWSATASLGGTALLLDGPKRRVTLANEAVINSAEVCGPYWCEGGAKYDCIFDASQITAGGPIAIALYGETYDVDTTT